MSKQIPSRRELMGMSEKDLMLLVKREVEEDPERFTSFVWQTVKDNKLPELERMLTVLKGLIRYSHPDSDEWDHYDFLCGVVWERTLGHMVREVGEA